MELDRRDFLQAGLAAGAGMLLSACGRRKPVAAGAAAVPPSEQINVALIGFGAQGQVLLDDMLKVPGLKFRAVCDIWDYNLQRGLRTLQKFGHAPTGYEDYRELLEKEKELDAVVVATPDFRHAEHSVAALQSGRHVYCEKMMSNTVEGARSMVRAMKDTGKLLQIGHQRRSSPRYQFVLNELIKKAKIAGRLLNANAQWNRSLAASQDIGYPEKYAMPEAKLKQYGFANMREFRNWRWFKRYSGGPISDLGAHQIDILNWFLDAHPKSVMAGGSSNYFTDREWYDNVMVIYDYETAAGPARAFYQVLTTTSSGGYFESFMGSEGTIKISENPSNTKIYREANAPDWQNWVDDGLLVKMVAPEVTDTDTGDVAGAAVVDVRESAALDAFDLPVTLDMKPHYYHLKNFFETVRGKAKLNCPADEAFRSEAAVFKVNEAVEARKMLEFTPQDFEV